MALNRILVGAVAVALIAVLVLGSFGIIPLSRTNPASPLPYPTGNRVLAIRILAPNNSWKSPVYTATDILRWINDLKPTTLNRVTDGPQDPNAPVPVSPGQPPMNVRQFLQFVVGNMSSPQTIFSRLTLKDYLTTTTTGFGPASAATNATFMAEAQNIYSLYSSLSPPQTLLSLDNENDFVSAYGTNAPQQETVVTANLRNIGFTSIAWGACQPSNVPNGLSSFAMLCIKPATSVPGCTPDYAGQTTVQTSQPSIMEVEQHIDVPTYMGNFENFLTVDQEAQALTNLASNQSLHGYHFVYPIYQIAIKPGTGFSDWDATARITSATGPFHGQSLYQVIKSLMQEYNPRGSVGPDFAIALSPSSQTVLPGGSAFARVSVASLNSSGTISLRTSVSPPGPLTSLSTSSLNLGLWSTGSSTLTVSTTSSTPLGSYDVAVDSYNATVSRTAHFTLVVSPTTSQPPPGPSPGTNICGWCNIFPKVGTSLALFMVGGALGLILTLTVTYLMARARLANVRRMKRLSKPNYKESNNVI